MAVWAIVLLLSGTYETLIAYAMVAFWTFYGLMVLGVMLLRRQQPDLPRPYKMWGYPVTPLLFLAVTVYVPRKYGDQPARARRWRLSD